jgi:hypothetical protein
MTRRLTSHSPKDVVLRSSHTRLPGALRSATPESVQPVRPRVQVPFCFLENAKLADRLNLFDDGAVIWEVINGESPPPAPAPYDPLTSWVALAYLGGLEEGGPCLKPELNREARLAVASEILDREELLVVETIAVPRRYRNRSAYELEETIRSATSYLDRLWAACWLTLIGWTESAQCCFADVSPEFPMGEIDHWIRSAYMREHGLSDAGDIFSRARIGGSHEATLIHRRISICQTHYKLNGPPPHECVCQTLPPELGWREVLRLVPQEQRR